MDYVNATLVSLTMAVDALTVNATNGISEKNIKPTKIIIIGTCFGIAQFLMPTIGYFIGYGFKDYLEQYIPWIAFSLLCLLGLKSLFEWIKEFKNRKNEASETIKEKKITPLNIFIQSIATSIDALCIGFVYLDSSISEAVMVFTMIGITTIILSSLSGLLASKIGSKLEKRAGLVASLVFFIIGIKILIEGLL